MHAAREGCVHSGVLFYTQGHASLSACYTVGTQGAEFSQNGLPKDFVEIIFADRESQIKWQTGSMYAKFGAIPYTYSEFTSSEYLCIPHLHSAT